MTMRAKFTVANLLLLTAIAALGGQIYRNRIQSQELAEELALHERVRDQAQRVRARELELQASVEQLASQLRSYPWLYIDIQRPVDAARPTLGQRGRDEYMFPPGARRDAARVRFGEAQLVRDRQFLQHLESALRQVED